MAGKQKYTAQQMIDALTEAHGLLSLAARIIGCDRGTVRNYINRYPTVKRARDDAKDRVLDMAENNLYQKVAEGDITAIKYFLSTVGRERGYVTRSEQDVNVGGKLQVVDDDPPENNWLTRAAGGDVD